MSPVIASPKLPPGPILALFLVKPFRDAGLSNFFPNLYQALKIALSWSLSHRKEGHLNPGSSKSLLSRRRYNKKEGEEKRMRDENKALPPPKWLEVKRE